MIMTCKGITWFTINRIQNIALFIAFEWQRLQDGLVSDDTDFLPLVDILLFEAVLRNESILFFRCLAEVRMYFFSRA